MSPPPEYEIPAKVTSVWSRCSNLYGQRTANFCSHAVTGLLLISIIFNDKKIIDPTPRSTKNCRSIDNNGQWIKNINSFNAWEQRDYLCQIFQDENWIMEDSSQNKLITEFADLDQEESDDEHLDLTE